MHMTNQESMRLRAMMQITWGVHSRSNLARMICISSVSSTSQSQMARGSQTLHLARFKANESCSKAATQWWQTAIANSRNWVADRSQKAPECGAVGAVPCAPVLVHEAAWSIPMRTQVPKKTIIVKSTATATGMATASKPSMHKAPTPNKDSCNVNSATTNNDCTNMSEMPGNNAHGNFVGKCMKLKSAPNCDAHCNDENAWDNEVLGPCSVMKNESLAMDNGTITNCGPPPKLTPTNDHWDVPPDNSSIEISQSLDSHGNEIFVIKPKDPGTKSMNVSACKNSAHTNQPHNPIVTINTQFKDCVKLPVFGWRWNDDGNDCTIIFVYDPKTPLNWEEARKLFTKNLSNGRSNMT